jgi:ABC-type lipoprotein release transport system permease subunit
MITKALRHFFITFILCTVLIAIIYTGFYLNVTLRDHTWYKTATFFSFIFIWSVLFLITVFAAMKGVEQVKQVTRKKLEHDFLAWLGYLIVLNNQQINMDELLVFYRKIFEEHEFEDAPDLKKYYDAEGKLTVNKEIIYDLIKQDMAEMKK